MFLSCQRLHQFTVETIDGRSGTLKQIYVDITKWIVRYFVTALHEGDTVRGVFVSPISIFECETRNKIIYVNLSHRHMLRSPGIDENKPLTRKIEQRINEHYRLKPYWRGTGDWGNTESPQSLQNQISPDTVLPGDVSSDSKLFRFNELINTFLASGGRRLGRIVDLMINGTNWKVGYIVIDHNEQAAEKRFLLEPTNSLRINR